MSAAGDLTPRVLPAVDRRHPDLHAESVVLHPEAAAAAILEARTVIEAGQGLENAAVLAGLAMVRKLQEIARRGARYPLGINGDCLVGIHPADVHVALTELVRWGGDEGPRAEDAMAKALAEVDKTRAERAQKAATAPCRRPDARAQVAADLAVARSRAAVRTIVSGSRR